MGGLFSWFWERPPAAVVLLGLDAAGKSTAVGLLKTGEALPMAPTIGMTVEKVMVDGCEVTIWDIGGQSKLRPLWKEYFTNCQGMAFMVDAADRQRFDEANESMHTILRDVSVDVPILILVNKVDLPTAASAAQVRATVRPPARFTKVEYVECVARDKTHEGLVKGMVWLVRNVDRSVRM